MSFLQTIFHRHSANRMFPQELSGKDINLKNINAAVAVVYETEILSENAIYLNEPSAYLECDFERKYIRLLTFTVPEAKQFYPIGELCTFCNEMNQLYPLVTTFVGKDQKVFFQSEYLFCKQLDVVQLHKTISAFDSIVHEIYAEYMRRFPNKEQQEPQKEQVKQE